jgi:hypothetical protein
MSRLFCEFFLFFHLDFDEALAHSAKESYNPDMWVTRMRVRMPTKFVVYGSPRQRAEAISAW